MAALIDAIDVKRKMCFEFENAPYYCLDVEVSTPTARGGQTLVRLKMRNLLTRSVFDKTFKAGEKFKEPDLQIVPASYLYSDGDGSHFLDQESYETLTLNEGMVGDALDFLVEGALIQLHKFNGNPIGLQLPTQVELDIVYTEPGVRGARYGQDGGGAVPVEPLQPGRTARRGLGVSPARQVPGAEERRGVAGAC